MKLKRVRSILLGASYMFVVQHDPFIGPSTAAPASEAPVKRKRGRPPGSKNKKTLAAGAAAADEPEKPKRKRGRPPKVYLSSPSIFS